MSDFLERITSRKFLLTVFGALTVILNTVLELGLSENDLTLVSGILVSFIGAEGVADAIARGNRIGKEVNDVIKETEVLKK